MDDAMELPFAPACLVPLICAWRATAARLPERERATLALEQLRNWGVASFDEWQELARAVAFLRDARIDVDAPLSSARGDDNRVITLVPPETSCVVCGCSKLHLLRRADATAWSFTTQLPRVARLYDKRCSDCGATHSHSRVVAAPAVLLVPVEHEAPGGGSCGVESRPSKARHRK